MKSNIMDYSYVLFAFSGILSLMSAGRSLLVGIDESKKQLVCGLVDTIGKRLLSCAAVTLMIIFQVVIPLLKRLSTRRNKASIPEKK